MSRHLLIQLSLSVPEAWPDAARRLGSFKSEVDGRHNYCSLVRDPDTAYELPVECHRNAGWYEASRVSARHSVAGSQHVEYASDRMGRSLRGHPDP